MNLTKFNDVMKAAIKQKAVNHVNNLRNDPHLWCPKVDAQGTPYKSNYNQKVFQYLHGEGNG